MQIIKKPEEYMPSLTDIVQYEVDGETYQGEVGKKLEDNMYLIYPAKAGLPLTLHADQLTVISSILGEVENVRNKEGWSELLRKALEHFHAVREASGSKKRTPRKKVVESEDF